MKTLPDRQHLNKLRDRINEKLAMLIDNETELALVELISSYHVDMDNYIDLLEQITIDSQFGFLQKKWKLEDLKKSYDMILNAYDVQSKQEIKNIGWMLAAKRRLDEQ